MRERLTAEDIIKLADIKQRLIDHLSDPSVVITEFTMDASESNSPYRSFEIRTYSEREQGHILSQQALDCLTRFVHGL